MAFLGFPIRAVHFYQDLEEQNTKEFWAAHKSTYDDDVRAPMEALVAELADFGAAKVYRPYRDVRFSHDKTPYKDHQGAIVNVFKRAGWYVAIGPDGLLAGGGCYALAPDQLTSFRRAVGAGAPGEQLAAIVTALESAGFEVSGETLKTAPRGFSKDHPLIDLLRHKSLSARRHFGTPPWLDTPEALAHVRAAWEGVRPLVDWLDKHVGPSEEGR